MSLLELQPFGITDPGKVRQNNEDALLVGDGKDETLFVVADGVGGFEAGEVASSLAVDVLRGLESGDSFERAIEEANRRILAAGRDDERLSGMGTTVVAVRFGGTRREPVVELAHVGDSRAYLVRGGELKPVTEDHSLVADLVRSGDLTRDQAAEHPQKNLITRALGAEDEVEVDTTVLPVEAGDRFVLCSDGLTDMLSDAEILDLLERDEDADASARRLVHAANSRGGEDNITVVLFAFRDDAVALEETVRLTPDELPDAPAVDDDEDTLSGLEPVPAVTTAVVHASEIERHLEQGPPPSRPSRPEPRARRAILPLVLLVVLLLAIAALVLWGLWR